MAKWVKGNFRDYNDRVCEVPKIGTLTFIETVNQSYGVYNIYELKPWGGDKFYVVVFGNNEKLAEYVAANEHNLFSIKLIEEGCPIDEYTVYLSGLQTHVTARTVAAAMVIARRPVSQ